MLSTQGCAFQGDLAPSAPHSTPLPCTPCHLRRYVALVSGLGVSDGGGSPLRLQLLVDYLGGLLGGEGERGGVVGRIARVVVAGGLLKTSSALSQPTAYSSVRQQAAALGPLRCVAGGSACGRRLAWAACASAARHKRRCWL